MAGNVAAGSRHAGVTNGVSGRNRLTLPLARDGVGAKAPRTIQEPRLRTTRPTCHKLQENSPPLHDLHERVLPAPSTCSSDQMPAVIGVAIPPSARPPCVPTKWSPEAKGKRVEST